MEFIKGGAGVHAMGRVDMEVLQKLLRAAVFGTRHVRPVLKTDGTRHVTQAPHSLLIHPFVNEADNPEREIERER